MTQETSGRAPLGSTDLELEDDGLRRHHSAPSVGPDDRPASSSRGRRASRSWLRSLAPILLGLVLGALLGLVVGAVMTPTALAVTRVEVLPDPPLPAEAEQSTTDPDRFVQAQVLVLGGQDAVAGVTRELGLAGPPKVSVSQVGTTDVVELDVRAARADDAIGIAQALVDGYRRQRQEDLRGRVDASLAVVNRQLGQLDAAGGSARTNQEYTRLLTVRNQLQLVRDSEQDALRLVDQARAVDQSRWLAAIRTGLMGLVLGALLGLLVKLVRDRRSQAAPAGRRG